MKINPEQKAMILVGTILKGHYSMAASRLTQIADKAEREVVLLRVERRLGESSELLAEFKRCVRHLDYYE